MAGNAAHATMVGLIRSKDALCPDINPEILGKAGVPLAIAAQVFPGRAGNKRELIRRNAYYVAGVALTKIFAPVRKGRVP